MAKTAVVTGGNRGIGLEVTRALLAREFDVVVVARDFTDFAFMGHPKVRRIVFDLTQVDKIPALAASFGSVDVLINNAGVMYSLPYDAYPKEKIESMVKLNLEAPVRLIEAVSKPMIEKGGGRIVNNASIAGQIGHPDIWYGATKAGLINATKSFAKLFGKQIVINAVAPSPVETQMLEVIPEARREAFLRNVITGRFATAEEIATTIVWLATESPEYINGTCIDINNGAFPR